METNESSLTPDAEREAFKEKLKSLSFGRVPGANREPKGTRAKPNPAWERGIKGEHRPGGGFMPFIGADHQPIRMKDWGENRHKYEANLAQLRKPTED